MISHVSLSSMSDELVKIALAGGKKPWHVLTDAGRKLMEKAKPKPAAPKETLSLLGTHIPAPRGTARPQKYVSPHQSFAANLPPRK